MLRTKNLKINQISRIISAIVGENSVSTGESVRYFLCANKKTCEIRPSVGCMQCENLKNNYISFRKTHGEDCSHHSGATPDLVVWPKDVRDVSEIAKFCNR